MNPGFRWRDGMPWVAVCLMLAAIAGACSRQIPQGWQRLPTNAPTVRYEGISFSPPQGQDWGQLPFPPAPTLVGYAKLTAEAGHSIVAAVSVAYVDAAKDSSTMFDGQIAFLKSENQLPRFRNDRRVFRKIEANGTQCVRVDGPMEDIGSPSFRGEPLELTLHDLHCRHPSMPGLVVSLSISERMKPGSTSTLSEAETENFLSSMKLDPTPLKMNGVTVGVNPVGMAAGNGAVWVAVYGEGAVKRIDPTSLRITQSVATGKGTDGVAITAQGTWAGASEQTVRLLDAVTAQVKAQVDIPADPSYMSASDSAVWVSLPGAKEIARIDPVTRKSQVLVLGERPEGLAATQDGVWVSIANPPGVTFVRGSPLERDATIPLPSPQVANRFFGGWVLNAFGSVWVGDFQTRLLRRVDLVSRVVTASIDVGQSPVGLAAYGGMLWVAISGEHTLVRVDPQSNRIVGRPILVGPRPLEVVSAFNALWLSLGNGGLVVRIVPPSP